MKTNQVTTKKKKLDTSAICTMEQAQEASKTHTEKTIELQKVEVQMNEEVNEIKSRYTDEITELKETLETTKDLLEAFAREQRASWGDRKSFELPHTVIGFRCASPKVSKQKQFTWDAVLELMKKNRSFKQFIRVKEEINKEAILSLDITDKKNSSLLRKLNDECFLYIEQGEDSFYINPKKEAV